MDFSKNLRTERFALRPVALWDIIFFLRLVGDVRVRQFLGAALVILGSKRTLMVCQKRGFLEDKGEGGFSESSRWCAAPRTAGTSLS